MHTDKTILTKGIKYIAWALPLYFIGPSVVYNAFINKQNTWHYLVLGIGIIISFFAIFLTFKGLKTILNSMFHGNR
ncbi:DUF6095 family protein [Flavobacterium humi]|uniref:Uncharacterized protein n=1 Tax=Flavobacterium humi TaxID=2562683 RepID=A0A4Z0LC08_9FLAO|nr:DUF6095 family protein [Flavobacterium humi]TGD59414.1 hypothetical protein E4635_00320 [Flavobacterium humi]